MPDDKPELAACPAPWCSDNHGEVRPVGMGMNSRAVRCTKCGCCGPIAQTEAEAIAAWNKRAQSPTPTGDVGELLDWARGELQTFERCSRGTSKQLIDALTRLSSENEALTAQRDRLREALEAILDRQTGPNQPARAVDEKTIALARTALKETTDGQG